MARRSCPYCYRAFESNRLWFQCAGRGSPGHDGCYPADDAERFRLTGFSEQLRPAFPPAPRQPWQPWPARRGRCPTCYGETAIRACPHCHSPLPVNFGEANSPLIAMVGAKGTGKTVYMTVLANELRNRLRRRFDADVRMTGGGQAGFRSSQQWLESNVDLMYRDRELFPQTSQAPGGLRQPLVFEWRRRAPRPIGLGHTFRTSFLSFYDTAGEDLTDLVTAHDQVYLGAADALILLLDPFMIPMARETIDLPGEAMATSTESTVSVVGRITEALRTSKVVRTNKMIQIPVAVVFAKMDAFFDVLGPNDPLRRESAHKDEAAFDETNGRKTHEYVKSLLHQWNADDIDTHLRFNYARYRYFAVSALGAEPDYQNAVVSSSGVTPHRVDEPLVWLLSQFKIVPRRTYR
jgi:hypothetical protein